MQAAVRHIGQQHVQYAPGSIPLAYKRRTIPPVAAFARQWCALELTNKTAASQYCLCFWQLVAVTTAGLCLYVPLWVARGGLLPLPN